MAKSSTDPGADFAKAEQESLGFMLRGRLIVLTLIAVWVLVTLPIERSLTYVAVAVVFCLLGAVPYVLTRQGHGGTWVIGLFLLLDAALLSYLLIVPNPYGLEGWSPQLNLRTPGFLYLGVFLVYMGLSYRPVLVVWAGVAAVVSWSVGNLWVIMLPETKFFSSGDVLDAGLGLNDAVDLMLDPDAVGITRWINQVVFLASITLILTLTVWRSRKLVRRQVAAENQRSTLSRYFSPKVMREITTNANSLETPKVQPVAVLFADMVGFTAISERLDPEALVGLLRDFHGRLARAAMAHDGTVDKYIGDAIMVHFGTPDTHPDDAVRALRCASDMLQQIERMNSEVASNGHGPIRIGIGVHYGDAIVGNIGDAERLEYTVLGDTVNVASRLESLTRDLSAELIVSDSLIEAVRRQGVEPDNILPKLRRGPDVDVRGRQDSLLVWHQARAL